MRNVNESTTEQYRTFARHIVAKNKPRFESRHQWDTFLKERIQRAESQLIGGVENNEYERQLSHDFLGKANALTGHYKRDAFYIDMVDESLGQRIRRHLKCRLIEQTPRRGRRRRGGAGGSVKVRIFETIRRRLWHDRPKRDRRTMVEGTEIDRKLKLGARLSHCTRVLIKKI